MGDLVIRLTPEDGGGVKIEAAQDDWRHEHRAPAAEVQAVRRQAAKLLASFEDGWRPFADPVELLGLGAQLRDAFLRLFADRLAAPAGQGNARFLFASADPDCLNLPWELLPGAGGRFLVEDARCTLRRASRPSLPAESAPPVALPLRVLFAACAPTDQPGLDYEKEEEAILRVAHGLGPDVHLDFAEQGTFDELRELISTRRPHVVFLSGHGAVRDDVGSFAFENERGECDLRDAHEMADQLFAGRGVRLVFLNGCQTAQAAAAGICQTLTADGRVPLALGWGASIADDRATDFARIFFREIAAGHPVDQAVAMARQELLARGRVRHGGVDLLDASFALPQLHAADGTSVLTDPAQPRQPVERPGIRHELLDNQIPGLREGFVGRRRLLQRTLPALRRGEKTILLLTGIGGAGKSTLATRLANRLVRDGWRAVALAARREEASQFCLRLVEKLAAACQRLGREGDERTLMDGNRPLAQRLRLAVEILNEAKILLVLDNLESLLPLPPAAPRWEAPEFAEFFRELTTRLTGEGRVLLTCRYLPPDFDGQNPGLAHEPMPDFTEADFLKYLRRHEPVARRIERGELSEELIAQFHRKLGATPRFVRQASVVLATMDPDRLAEQLDALASPGEGDGGDDLRRLQQEYFRDLFLPQLYAALAPPDQAALSRLALAREALPLDGVARVGATASAEDFVRHGVGLGLLQRFGEGDETELFAIYPLQREFFTSPERLPSEAEREAHLAAAAFFRACYEKDREQEIRLGVMAELLACLHHATEANDFDGRLWATDKLAWPLIGRAEYRGALALAESLMAQNRHPDLLQIAARCALDTGDWPRARAITQEEQQLRQTIGDRAGEAGTWHQLATIDLNEGDYPKARENFAKALAMLQAIGDRAGEAATFAQIGAVAWQRGMKKPAAILAAISFQILHQINSANQKTVWGNLTAAASALELDQPGFDELRRDAVEQYQRDRGTALVQQAFAEI